MLTLIQWMCLLEDHNDNFQRLIEQNLPVLPVGVANLDPHIGSLNTKGL